MKDSNLNQDIIDLMEEKEKYRRALLFYANEDYYYDDDIASDGTVHKFSTVEEDAGKLARKTLAQCVKD